MNSSSLGDAVRHILSFIVFGIGILSMAFGVYLIINSLITGEPYLIEGGTSFLLGLMIASVADLIMVNRKQREQTEYLIQQNQTLNQRMSFGQGGGLMGMVGNIMGEQGFSKMEIIDEQGNTLYNSNSGRTSSVKYEDVNSELVQKDIKALMINSNLSKEDATVAVFLKGKSKEALEVAKIKAAEDGKYELAAFIKKMMGDK